MKEVPAVDRGFVRPPRNVAPSSKERSSTGCTVDAGLGPAKLPVGGSVEVDGMIDRRVPATVDGRSAFVVRIGNANAVVLTDPRGVVVHWSTGAEQLTGHPGVKVLGAPIANVFGADDTTRTAILEVLERAAENGSARADVWRVQDDGSRVPTVVVAMARRGPDVDLGGFALSISDRVEPTAVGSPLLASQADFADRLAEFTRLYDFASLLAQARDVKPALDVLLTQATAITRSNGAVVLGKNRSSGKLDLLASVGLPVVVRDRLRHVPVGEGACGNAVATRRLVVFGEVGDDDAELLPADERELMERYGIHGIASVPLLAPGNEVVGAFSTFFPEPQRLSDQQLRQVAFHAYLATGILANARSSQDRPPGGLTSDELLATIQGWLGEWRRASTAIARARATTAWASVSPWSAQVGRFAEGGSKEVVERPMGARTTTDWTNRQESSWDENQRARLLRTIPMFRALSADAIRHLAAISRARRAKPGELVFLEGDPVKAIKVVALGQIAVVRAASFAQPVILRIVVPGEVVGLEELATTPTHRAAAVAQVATTYLRIPVDAFFQLMDTHPAFSREVVVHLVRQMEDTQTRICALQTMDAEQRMAMALLDLATRVRRPGGSDDGTKLQLRREDLAELAGANASTTSRTISRWTRMGIVAAGRRHLVIQDPRALRALVDGTGPLAPRGEG